MPDYSSLVPSIATQEGVPVNLAMAYLGQESGVGQASSNVGQILPSTAANPGYGLSSLPMGTPADNIRSSLKYLKAKAAANGFTDLTNPSQAAGALQLYNGGGDPNYVSNVAGRMGPAGAPIAAAAGQSLPGQSGYVPPTLPAATNYQATPLPPMPDSFGAAPPQAAPTAPAQTDLSAHQGDTDIATGLALLGGNGIHDAFAKAGQAFAGSQETAIKAAEANSNLINAAQERDSKNPVNAATAASLRAQGWAALNAPNGLTQAQAANANVTERGQDVSYADAMARAQLNTLLTKGQPKSYVLPGTSDGSDQFIEQTKDGAGNLTFHNATTGETSSTLPPGAISADTYKADQAHGNKLYDKDNAAASDVLNQGTMANQKIADLNRVQSDLSQPGVLAGPGAAAEVGRSIDNALGTNIFSNLSEQQTANLDLKGLNWANVKSATQGTGRLMANEINILSKNAPTISTDPVARQNFFDVLRNAASRQGAVANDLSNMDPASKTALFRSGGLNNWLYQRNQDIINQQDQARAAVKAQQAPTMAQPGAAPSTGRRPLSSFGTGAQPTQPVAPQSNPQPQQADEDPVPGYQP